MYYHKFNSRLHEKFTIDKRERKAGEKHLKPQ